MAMTESAIRVRQVVKTYNKNPILRSIDLDIDKGEFVTLLGPSGCGKTTLLRIISGLESLDSGEVHISNRLMNNVPPEHRPVNMVFQSYALFPHKNVFENIAFGLRLRRIPYGEVQERVTEALRMVRLEGFEQRKVTELSGGQAQRVAVARALVNRPEVILLDEPLGALDLQLRKQMQMELRSIHRSLNMTFVYVTHDQEEALTLSDRIVLMNQGEIVQQGSPEEMYNSPNSVFAANFIGECNIFQVAFKERRGAGMLVDLQGDEIVVHATPEHNLSEGRAYHIAIRPEKICLSDDPYTELNAKEQRLIGVLKDVTFLGSVKTYTVELQSGVEMSVQQHTGQVVRPYAVGQKVALHVNTEAIQLLDK